MLLQRVALQVNSVWIHKEFVYKNVLLNVLSMLMVCLVCAIQDVLEINMQIQAHKLALELAQQSQISMGCFQIKYVLLFVQMDNMRIIKLENALLLVLKLLFNSLPIIQLIYVLSAAHLRLITLHKM